MNSDYFIDIIKQYRAGLKELDKFSHVIVFWWADKNDNKEARSVVDTTPPYGEDALITGVFATRAEYRPNPIAITTVNILEVNQDKGFVKVLYIDAFDGTPILDVKPFDYWDMTEDARVPEWWRKLEKEGSSIN